VNAPGGDRFVSAEFASTTQWATAKALAYYRTARRRGMPLVKASSNPSAPEENLICFQTVMYTFFISNIITPSDFKLLLSLNFLVTFDYSPYSKY
jgi:hypothetical protein